MDQYQNSVDVLVIDQTHNPGGDAFYAQDFFGLFIKQPANGLVEHLHVDRKWVYDLQNMATALIKVGGDAGTVGNTMLASANTVDGLTSTNTVTTPAALQFAGPNILTPDDTIVWKKPLSILVDELSGSCGDIFPMLIQRNNIAKIFGQPTMSLGGNVDDAAITLPYSQAVVNVTRGLYTTYRPDGAYTDADLVENVGIIPDIPYFHTVTDFRAGYVTYVKAFSDAALQQIPNG